MTQRRKDLKFIQEMPEGEEVVGMVEFLGTLFLATKKRVYKYEMGAFRPVDILVEGDDDRDTE